MWEHNLSSAIQLTTNDLPSHFPWQTAKRVEGGGGERVECP